ncbi:restriction endonuclease subunit S [Mycoplasma sp. VS31B]
MNKNELKPSIRFKGFTDAWEKQQFNDIVYKSGERNVHSFPLESYSVSNKDGFISQKEQFKYGGIVTIADKSKSLIITPQTFAYNPARLDVGSIGYWNGSVSVLISPMYEVFKVYQDVVDAYFLWYWLKSDLFNRIVNLNQEGGVRTCFKFPTLLEKYILIPKDLEEQNKVSNLIMLIDSLLTFYKRKSEKLENLKKSLLEKMFVSDGEQFPAIRFKGFTNAWEKRLVKNVADTATGLSNTQDNSATGIYPFFIRSETPLKSNRFIFDEEAVITIGDGNIGRVFHYINGKYDLHQRCYKIANFKEISGKYFYWVFSTFFYERVIKMSAKATVDSVRLNMITDMEIKVPHNILEQKSISIFFDQITNLITFYKRKCDKLENIKKSLLEKMFC